MTARGGSVGRTAVLTPGAPGATTQLSEFIRLCEVRTAQRFGSYQQFDAFAAEQYEAFWTLFLEWSGLRRGGSAEPACIGDDCEHAEFFPGLRLSYVENLLDAGADDAVALIAVHASRPAERLTRRELRERVRATAGGLRRLGVAPGDRVVAVAANNAAMVVAGLATAALGASLSTAPPDMGVPAIVSRFAQLRPTVLLASLSDERPAADRQGAHIEELVRRLPTLAAVVALDDVTPPVALDVPVHRLSEIGAPGAEWIRFPFNHPLLIAFTSGTTGAPKCIVHGAGGTLLEHLKEHRLHVDLGPEDRLFFHTSTGWMMWNWQLSALASGSAIVVYDGTVESPETLWRIVSEHDVSVFGTSPPYLQLCEDGGFSPRGSLPLDRLRAVLSTGSILHDWQYDWVEEHVGRVALQSISGGTDIMGCFVLGNPELPVRRGWIQCRSLGLDVRAADAGPGSVGELVCANPFPSRPLGLVGDDGSRFHDAYFARNPGMWTHGDLIEFDADGQARIHGRCDGVVNVHGIRIGPAEIYRALRAVPEVQEAIAVEQVGSGARPQSRLVLLVVLRPPAALDARLTIRIRSEIARYASPAHVPELILQVSELPTTHSGKRSEHAARYAVNGDHVGNSEALANPRSLDEIAGAVPAARATVPVAGSSTEARVLAIWEQVLGVSRLRPDDDFFDLGGTSFAALTLLMTIHEELGVELPLSTLIYARTPGAVAALIDGPADQRVPPVVLLRSGTARRPLFVVHSIWGDVLPLRPLARATDTDRPVYGLQSPALDPDMTPYARIEDMAAAYVETLRSMQPSGPYAIAGYSFGGLVAYEMARQLRTAREQVEWLGLIDPAVSHRCLKPLQQARFVPGWLLRRARARLGLRARLDRYRRDRVAPWARLTGPVDAASPVVRRLIAANEAAFYAYRPRPYAGAATFFYSGTRPRGIDVCDPLPIWRRLIRGGLEIEPVPGEHDSLLTGPYGGVVAERVAERLRRT